MLSLSSYLRISLPGVDHFEVRTDKMTYSVAVRGGEVQVLGPGVKEVYTTGGELPEDMTHEGLACMAVLVFEQGFRS